MICLAAQRPHQPTPELFHEVRGDGQVVCEETAFTKLDRFVFLSESQTEFWSMWKDVEECCHRITGAPNHRLEFWSRPPNGNSYHLKVQQAWGRRPGWDVTEVGENYIATKTCNLNDDPSKIKARSLAISLQGEVADFVQTNANAIAASLTETPMNGLRMSSALEHALAAASGIVFCYQHFDGIAYRGIVRTIVIWDAFSRSRGVTDAVWHKWASV